MQQLAAINKFAARLVADKQAIWQTIKTELAGTGIHVLQGDELTAGQRAWLEQLFLTHIFPILTPIAADPAHPFPVHSQQGTDDRRRDAARQRRQDDERPHPDPRSARALHSPRGRGRASPRNSASSSSRASSVCSLTELFSGFDIKSQGAFRVLRDSDIELQEEAEDLVRSYESQLKRRRRGNVIRLEIEARDAGPLAEIRHRGTRGSAKKSSSSKTASSALADTAQLIVADRPDLLFKPFNIRFPERIREFNGDCFAAVRKKDIVVHHPYESFDVVVQYLRQAVADPNVMAIKWTLYRTSRDSPIVQALKEAVEAGKSVTAVVELKARFDEAANIRWARDLESAGVHVVYGFIELKTHAKLGLIVRREGTRSDDATAISAPATIIRRRRAFTPTCRCSPPIRRSPAMSRAS